MGSLINIACYRCIFIIDAVMTWIMSSDVVCALTKKMMSRVQHVQVRWGWLVGCSAQFGLGCSLMHENTQTVILDNYFLKQ